MNEIKIYSFYKKMYIKEATLETYHQNVSHYEGVFIQHQLEMNDRSFAMTLSYFHDNKVVIVEIDNFTTSLL